MAIIFTNASHQNLTVTGGTPGHLSYIGRLATFDPRLDKHLDFTHLGDDLVYSRLWLPDDTPAEFTDIERLAIENDLAEMRRVRQLVNRERLPQIGIALISALPPDSEITLDEAKEIAWQIVSEARRGYRLAVYLAIHDPGLKSPGGRNRHSHAFMLTREIGPAGLAPAKLRKGIALVRNRGGSFVAEGINWPDLTSEVLRTKLLEYGRPRSRPNAMTPQPTPEFAAFWMTKSPGLRFPYSVRSRCEPTGLIRSIAYCFGSPSDGSGTSLPASSRTRSRQAFV
jgi:hypothetical protein